MAEGVGFEPTVELPLHGISSAAPSATRPPFRPHTAYGLIDCPTLGRWSPAKAPRGAKAKLAEGRGFEPPRDLRPYPISSRTPSTGLGHPSAPLLSSTYLVSHLYLTRAAFGRVEVLPMFSNADRLRGNHGGHRYDLLDGSSQVVRGQVRVPLHHAQSLPPA